MDHRRRQQQRINAVLKPHIFEAPEGNHRLIVDEVKILGARNSQGLAEHPRKSEIGRISIVGRQFPLISGQFTVKFPLNRIETCLLLGRQIDPTSGLSRYWCDPGHLIAVEINIRSSEDIGIVRAQAPG
jgi:hypothetical protein